MRTLAFALALIGLVSVARAEGSPPSVAFTLAQFQQLIVKAKDDLVAAERDVKASAGKLSGAQPENRATAQQELEATQAKMKTAQQNLSALEQVDAVMREQGPLMLMIADLKRQRDLLPGHGTDLEQAQRSALVRQIAALEAVTSGAKEPTIGVLGILAIALIVLLVGLLVYLLIRIGRASGQEDEAAARIRLAKVVTLGAMAFIVLISAMTLLLAGIDAAVSPQDEKKTQIFFDIAKWIFGAVLPVVGAWVGGVMAYYFGKENFRAGAENAEKLMMHLTPAQKLESKGANDSGLDLADPAVALHHLPAAAKLEDADLTELRDKFTKAGKTHERLPILDAKDSPVACLHLSTLNKYTESLSETDKKAAGKMTLGALSQGLNWKPDATFGTVSPLENLTVVQALMKANRECSDVFVTLDGSARTAAKRWITSDDILRAANA